jgi:hypothetical protein
MVVTHSWVKIIIRSLDNILLHIYINGVKLRAIIFIWKYLTGAYF